MHPAYEDGFAYAPAEALACGVPVIVSEDTGMKELIDPGVTGMVLPTGDLGTLTETIEAAYRGEILAWLRRRRCRPLPGARALVLGISTTEICGVRDHATLLAVAARARGADR